MFYISLIKNGELIVDGSVHANESDARAEFAMMTEVAQAAARNYAGTFTLTLIDTSDATLATLTF